MVTLSPELATQEVEKWLDAIGVFPSQKEEMKVNINIISESMSNGLVIIDGLTLTQNLRRPIGPNGSITQLKYNSEIIVEDVQTFKKGIPEENDNRSTAAAICASTGNLYGIIGKMSSKDFNLASAIVLFFSV